MDDEPDRFRLIRFEPVEVRAEPGNRAVRSDRMKSVPAFIAGLVALVPASPAMACTLCYSRTAQDVRAAVFGVDFWTNAAVVLAPMPVLVASVLLLRRFSA